MTVMRILRHLFIKIRSIPTLNPVEYERGDCYYQANSDNRRTHYDRCGSPWYRVKLQVSFLFEKSLAGGAQ